MWDAQYGQRCARLTSSAALQEGCGSFQFEMILVTVRGGAAFFGPCTVESVY